MPIATPAAPTDEASRFAHANGIELCYDTFGDATRPALLLIMGLGTQMIAWEDAFCRRLADRGYYVVRFDNRDIGRSTWFDQEDVPNLMALFAKVAIGLKPKVPYTLKDMANDSVGLLDALGLDRAHVVGASMGGMIGQQMAIDHPARLATLTSIMSTTGDPKLPSPTPEARALLMGDPARNEDEAVAFYRTLMKVLRAGDFPDDEALDADRARAMWKRGYNPAGSGRQFAAIVASGNRTKALARVTVPTLVVHGRPDPLVPVEGGLATAAAIPGAKLLLIERMGHAMPMETWGELIDAIAAHAH